LKGIWVVSVIVNILILIIFSSVNESEAQSDGTVDSEQKISDTERDFTDTLDDDDFFGISVTSLGDLDVDGIKDLAVGAIGSGADNTVDTPGITENFWTGGMILGFGSKFF